jgi:flagellar motor switch/type III secretory pathway protein FliN
MKHMPTDFFSCIETLPQPKNESQLTSFSDSTADFLSKVQIGLQLELGDLTLSLSELLQLEQGNEIALVCQPEAEVALRIGVDVVAWGQLVTSDSELKLVITRLAEISNENAASEPRQSFATCDNP